MTKDTIVLICSILVALGLGILLFSRTDYYADSKIPEGYVRIDSYNYPANNSVSCMAITPECGYCPGEVIDGACYVKPGQSDPSF